MTMDRLMMVGKSNDDNDIRSDNHQPKYDLQQDDSDSPCRPSILLLLSSWSSWMASPPCFLIRVTAMAGLGGILFGYDLGVITAALPHLAEEFHMNPIQQEWTNSILYVGGFFGSLFGGNICDALGRKKSILITDILFLGGAGIFWVAPSILWIWIARILVGFSVALSGIADVSYLHEISPTQYRGAIVSVNEAGISLGFLLAFLVGSMLSSSASSSCFQDYSTTEGNDIPGVMSSWRIMFGLSGVVALFQFFGMLDMPESPKWLYQRGRHEESLAVLSRIRPNDTDLTTTSPTSSISLPSNMTESTRLKPQNTPPDLHSPDMATTISYDSTDAAGMGCDCSTTVSAVQPQEDDNKPSIDAAARTPTAATHCPTTNPNSRLGWSMSNALRRILLFGQKVIGTLSSSVASTFSSSYSFLRAAHVVYPRQSFILAFLAVTQQLCGQTAILSYAPQILAGAKPNSSNPSCYGWMPVWIGMTKFLVTLLVIWKIEAIGRRPLLISGMAAIAFGLLLLIVSARPKDDDDDDDDNNDGLDYFMTLLAIMLVVCGYSMSFGPLTWLVTSELFPTDIRGRALGFSTILNFASAILVTSTFLSMQSALGSTVLFAFYLFITLLGMLIAIIGVPETKEKSVRDIDLQLDHMILWRRFSNRESEEHLSLGEFQEGSLFEKTGSLNPGTCSYPGI